MDQVTLTRDGKRDLRFVGDMLAEAGGKWRNGREQTRWTELTLYRTAAGKLVLHRQYRTLWQGEENGSSAEVYADAKSLVEALRKDMADLDDELGGGRGCEFGSLDKELLEDAARRGNEQIAAMLVQEIE